MVVEEIRYDFVDFKRYADDFIHELVRLMIVSKMNSTLKGVASKEYFLNIINQIEGCEAYIVKYGQPVLYTKYRGMEFTDQKISTQFVRVNDHVIDVMIESVFAEFVKTFDSLASNKEGKVKWGAAQKGEKIDPLFNFFDLFAEAVDKVSTLDSVRPDSLMGKKFGIKNVNISRQATYIEFLIDGQLNILIINPAKKKKDESIVLLFGSDVAKAISSLMKQ